MSDEQYNAIIERLSAIADAVQPQTTKIVLGQPTMVGLAPYLLDANKTPIAQENEAIRKRFMSDYNEYIYDGDYQPALEQAMKDIRMLLHEVLPYRNGWVGTCTSCGKGICKTKGTHT